MSRTAMIEIGDRRIKATGKKIRTLKSILDKLGIYHILDEVVFFSPFEVSNQLKEVNSVKVWKIEKDGSIRFRNRFGQSGHFNYCSLAIPIPDLIDIHLFDMFYLDYREAKLLDDLYCSFIYGED